MTDERLKRYIYFDMPYPSHTFTHFALCQPPFPRLSSLLSLLFLLLPLAYPLTPCRAFPLHFYHCFKNKYFRDDCLFLSIEV
ncbi:unnamed protein product [Meloidogyne enterolobii]|uniref:Uncharacterized protein n=1 Tax=Meloidogyne enterolobii TaxID=390850 RepID=A0ACB0XKB5_MELEN